MMEGFPRKRLAAVGTGYFSQFHYDAWRRLAVDLCGICSLVIEDARTVAATFSNCRAFDQFEVMLDEVNPDLVDLIIPPKHHSHFIKACVCRGIQVICQKPFTQSLEEAEDAVALAEMSGVSIFVHENFRFQPWHMKIKDLLDAGRVGKVYQAYFRLRPGDGQGEGAYLNRQPYFQSMKRFLIHETAIHLIDVFRFFFGELTTVTAELTRLNSHIAGEDAGYIIFNFESGVRALFDGNRLSDHSAEDRRRTMGDMLVEGSKGTLRLNGDGQIFFRAFGHNEEQIINYTWQNCGFAGDSVYRTQKQIIQHLNDGRPVANNARDYLANLRVEEAVYRSNVNGCRVRLN